MPEVELSIDPETGDWPLVQNVGSDEPLKLTLKRPIVNGITLIVVLFDPNDKKDNMYPKGIAAANKIKAMSESNQSKVVNLKEFFNLKDKDKYEKIVFIGHGDKDNGGTVRDLENKPIGPYSNLPDDLSGVEFSEDKAAMMPEQYEKWEAEEKSNIIEGRQKYNDLKKQIANLVKKGGGVDFLICYLGSSEYDEVRLKNLKISDDSDERKPGFLTGVDISVREKQATVRANTKYTYIFIGQTDQRPNGINDVYMIQTDNGDIEAPPPTAKPMTKYPIEVLDVTFENGTPMFKTINPDADGLSIENNIGADDLF